MNVLKRMFRYVVPYKVLLAVSVVLMALSSLGEVLVSAVIYITTNGLMNKSYVSLENVPHLPEPLSQFTFSVNLIPFLIVLVFVFRGATSFFSKYFMGVVGLRAVRDCINDLFRHVSYLSCDCFSKNTSGDIISRISNDTGQIKTIISLVAIDVIKSPITILLALPVIFVMGGKLAFISVIVFPFVAVPIIALGKRLRKLSRQQMEGSSEIISFLQNTLMGIKVVKTFNGEKKENKRFRKITDKLYSFNCKTIRSIEMQRPLIEVMGAVGIGVAIYFALQVLSLDRFMTFIGSLYLLYDPAKKLSKINSVVQQAISSGERIFAVLDLKSTIEERPNAVEISEEVKTLDFENVSFSYNPDVDVLHNVDLSVKRGESVALVGLSGSGKTTLVNLLPRFYDVREGTLKINGIDVRDLKLENLRSKLAIVSQDTILFDGTIKENILYGRPEATHEDIVAAAKMAQAHKFIMETEKGYDTYVGERGLLLSGGQRQRISIARAVLKDPQILIFDEATAHLDNESERAVQKAIELLMRERTVFVIAHRLSTILNADKIVVMDQGKIVEQGKHSELLALNGQYKKLYDLQFNID